MIEATAKKSINKYVSDQRQQLIIDSLPLVKQVAGRLLVNLPNHLDKEDLISFGIIGLMDAVDKFKPEHGTKFSSYAYTRIKGSIIDELRKHSFLPRSIINQIKEYGRVQEELEHLAGREVSNKEIAQSMKVSEEEIDQTIKYINMYSTTSIDELLEFSSSKGTAKSSYMMDDQSIDPAKAYDKKEAKEALTIAINAMEERDKLILTLYYFEELTLTEIGQVLEVSESRVCQLHGRALARLKNQLTKLHY